MFNCLKKGVNFFFTGNFFIAICSTGMVLTTLLLNAVQIKVTPYLVFLTSSTYVLYNFHRLSFKMDFSGIKELKNTTTNIVLSNTERILFSLAAIIMIISLFFLALRVFVILIPLSILAVAYSVPLISHVNRKIKLRELLMVKTPLLALVWGTSTTIIPLMEQNISLFSSFVWMQMISCCLFIFALCIPFEIRDIEADKVKNIRTFPVIYGIKASKLTGIVVVALEIIIHHTMQSTNPLLILMLDISALTALFWILVQRKKNGIYFYKFLVDGTMLLRFLLVFIAIKML